ncbi:MAG TPA: glycosyltransferase family 2 protein [Anaerolineales bacterium]|nr:glycosyltransferase family 2 protein [Anaerolineales bacterium]
MTSPRVSFIVVTHARAEWLSGALESIQRQTVNSREIVVVVNGPDSKAEEVLRAHGLEVHATILDHNCGVGGGRNAGIALARGEILFFLDDDAELRDPHTVARLLTHFERDPDLGVVGLLVIDAAMGAIERRCIPFRNKRVPPGPTAACYFAGGACAIRRGVFDRVGLYDESLFYGGEELDLSYRLLDAGFRILFDPSVTVLHHAAGRGESLAPYFYARNRPWVALRHLPLLCCVTHIVGWWAWSLAQGFRKRAMTVALRGMRDCVVGIPSRWGERRPISHSTHRFLATNKGRLWY